MIDKITLSEEEDCFVAHLETVDQLGRTRLFVVCPVCTEPMPDMICPTCRRKVCQFCTTTIEPSRKDVEATWACTECTGDSEL